MKIVFRIILCLLIINTNILKANPNINLIAQLEQSPQVDQKNSSSDISSFNSDDFNKVISSDAIPEDRFHLIGQRLSRGSEMIPLFRLGESPVNIFYTDLKFNIEGSNLNIIGYHNGEEVARHTFIDLNIHSFQLDSEMLVCATRDGKIHAIDMVYLKNHLFRGPIPVFQNLIQNENFKEPFKMSFWTRGLNPNLVTNLIDSAQTIFPHNRKGEIYFKAGDLIFHRGEESTVKAFAGLSREVLLKNMVVRSEELMTKALLFSTDVFEKAKPELIQRLSRAFEPKEISIEDLSRSAIASIPSSSVEKLFNQVNHLATSDREIDKATLNEWINTYNIIKKEAQSKNPISLEGQDFSSVWQELMQSHINANKKIVEKPGFFKKYGMILATLSGVTTAISTMYLLEAKPILLAIDYLYDHAVPPILKIAEYRFPLLASVISLVSIIPLVQIVAWMSPYMMKSVAQSIRLTAGNLSEKLFVAANKWKEMSVWQKLVTFGARAQSALTISFWNHIASILRQPQFFRTLKMGVNPFTFINAESSLGRKLDLEKDLFFGVNSPLQKKDELERTSMKQQEASQLISGENQLARFAAFQLVALTLYQSKKIDPITLMELFRNDSTLGIEAQLFEFKNLNSVQKTEWLALTELVSKEWIQSIRSKGKLFEQVSPEEFEVLFKMAINKINRFQDSSTLRKRFVIFNDHANRYLKKFGQNVLLLGVEDGQFLGKVYANSFVSEQVRKVFVSDHLITAIYPAFWGERANPDKAMIVGGAEDGSDRNLLTFRPKDGSISNLYTNPEHMMDIWINVAAHFFGGASRYILLYQKEPPTEESKYLPMETLTIDQKHEKERAIRGTAKWIQNVADTRQSALGDYYIKTLKKQISTIQAGLILGVTFRMISLDPTINFAVASWYLFFVAGVWSYAWPWTIIGQGNHLEEERLKSNADQLLKLQIRLSQALRFNENNDISDITRELKSLYISSPSRYEKLARSIGSEPSNPNGGEYSEWSKKLLNYSEIDPPFPTKPSPIPSWIATWTGAITTTMMAISLGVFSLDPNNLTLSTLLFETAKAGALYTASYYIIGRTGILSKLINDVNLLIEYNKTKRGISKKKKESEEAFLRSCRFFFK